jgi:hypothetical protein
MNDRAASASLKQPAQTGITTRPLCPLERWYWVFGQISPLNGIARCRIEGHVSDDMLRQGLQLLQRRHPLLRARVVADGKGRNPHFVLDDSLRIDLQRDIVDTVGGSDGWVDALRRLELNRPFDTAKGPLLRVRVVQDATGAELIVVASHVIVDATGIMSLMREMLQLALGDDHERHELPFMPSFSDRFPPHNNGVRALLKTLWLQLRIELFHLRYRPVKLAFDRFVAYAQRKTDFIHHELSPEDTRTLIDVCQHQQASVHAALSAALMLAIIEDVKGRDSRQRNKALNMGIGSPVNLRKDMHPAASDSELGIFVGTFITFARNVNARGFWEVAQEFNQTMRQQSRDAEPFTIMNFVRKTMPKNVAGANGFIRLIEQKGPGNACLSNLGRYDFPAHIGGLSVSGAQFLAETSVTGTWVSTANTSHGQLQWNFSYTKDMFSDERASRLANRCIEILKQQLQ